MRPCTVSISLTTAGVPCLALCNSVMSLVHFPSFPFPQAFESMRSLPLPSRLPLQQPAPANLFLTSLPQSLSAGGQRPAPRITMCKVVTAAYNGEAVVCG